MTPFDYGQLRYRVISQNMIKNKLWKFESNDKLNLKLERSPNAVTPIDLYNSFMNTDSQRQQLEGFQLSPFTAFARKQENNRRERQAQNSSILRQSIRPDQNEKGSKQKQQYRQSLGGASKTMQRMHDQLISAEKQIEQKQLELISLNSELAMMQENQKVQHKHKEDIVNNQNMLKFKQEQFNNLQAIHSQIIEDSKKQIIKEQQLRRQIEEKFHHKKSILDKYRVQLAQKQNMIRHLEDLTKEKGKYQKILMEIKQAQAKKLAMRSGAIRQVVERLIKRSKHKLENQWSQKIKTIRDASIISKDNKQLKNILEGKGIKTGSFYSYSQLKFIEQFDFKSHPENQKLLELFDTLIQPRTFEIVEQDAEPQQLTTLKAQLTRMDDFKAMSDTQLKEKEAQIERLQQERKSLLQGIENKKKNNTK